MNTSRLYHIRKEIASGAVDFCAALALFGEILIVWEILHALATGDPVHAWVRVALITAVGAAILAAMVYLVVRHPQKETKSKRMGTIDAETICRIMGGTK